MNKHLHNSLRALCLILVVLLSLPMLAVKVEIDGIKYELVAESKQATVVSKSGKYSGEIVIPESVEHEGSAYRVTSIGYQAFYYDSNLNSVTIPNSVESIETEAFYHCSGLTSVTIGNSVTVIEQGAFSDCSGLLSVTIPNSVTKIPPQAFYLCSGLTSVTIGNSVTSIGESAFGACYELLDVYCYAENVPNVSGIVFPSSSIADITLHVPAASIDSYRATEPWSGFGKIIPLSGTIPPSNLTLTDGEEYENNIEQEVGILTYTRTLPNMLWNPLYVPFKIPYEDLQENYEVAYINAMHSYDNDDNGEIDDMVMEIVKIKAGTLKPNHPYLIKARNAEAMEMSIVQENATLYPAEITTLNCSSVYTKFEITGTYQEMTSGELNGSLVISTDGAWKKLSSTSTLKPFRFYLTISSREGSPVEIADEAMSRVRIRVMGEDDNETGIDEVKTANDELKSEIYDLSGRRVSAPAKGGVYIVNGKKVIY
ncbi:MAG: leucine-rich repeat domain-containing protein [Bacteroidaceae bacterium]|nr:leucine-rich repeat domain-containing protein [Bacteroidaceae bacterium]